MNQIHHTVDYHAEKIERPKNLENIPSDIDGLNSLNYSPVVIQELKLYTLVVLWVGIFLFLTHMCIILCFLS
ncbi:hypothetical protein HZS_1805 [Henneguya salminicola]|nr:hypothetical protein HZS_1805 [Henneguya salminicola]